MGCFLRSAVRRLGWELSRALYWELRRWIFSLTDWMCRSHRRTAFGTYQGASVMEPFTLWYGACGSVVSWDIMLKVGRSRVRFSMMSLNSFNLYNPSIRTRPWGLLSL
jgi:hypothetical protein